MEQKPATDLAKRFSCLKRQLAYHRRALDSLSTGVTASGLREFHQRWIMKHTDELNQLAERQEEQLNKELEEIWGWADSDLALAASVDAHAETRQKPWCVIGMTTQSLSAGAKRTFFATQEEAEAYAGKFITDRQWKKCLVVKVHSVVSRRPDYAVDRLEAGA